MFIMAEKSWSCINACHCENCLEVWVRPYQCAPEQAHSEVSLRPLIQCSLPSFFELECLSGPGWSVQQVSGIFCHFLPSTGIMCVPTYSCLYIEAGDPKPGPHAWDISLAQCLSFLRFPESHSGLDWTGLELIKIPVSAYQILIKVCTTMPSPRLPFLTVFFSLWN